MGYPIVADEQEKPPVTLVMTGKPSVMLTFGSEPARLAFADWLASGQCTLAFWNWMSAHGYRV